MSSLATGDKTKEELAAMAKHKKSQEEQMEDLVDRDDDANWRNDLPDAFSKLTDGHFPLFITFGKVRS